MEKNEKKILIVITTCGTKEDAHKLARLLVEKRIAACSQVSGPITSFYWWKENLETDEEWQVKFKILDHRYPEAERVILENHPYDLPQIIGVPAEKNLEDYALWVAKETRGN